MKVTLTKPIREIDGKEYKIPIDNPNDPNKFCTYLMDRLLRPALDSLVWNINKDWDFVIIVTGDGMVRTGKSVLALQCAAYLANSLKTKFSNDNVFFDSKGMIDFAQKAPKNTVIIYDEAREGLASAKRFSKIQQDLIDFFNECGQLNHIFILVLPDFFGLNWELATNRSEMLLNVYRDEENLSTTFRGRKDVPIVSFRRGYYDIYNRHEKQKLFWLGKRSGMRNYGMIKPTCSKCIFTNYYPTSESEYRDKKKEALARFDERHKEAVKERVTAADRTAYKLLSGYDGKLTELARSNDEDSRFYSDLLSRLRKKIGVKE